MLDRFVRSGKLTMSEVAMSSAKARGLLLENIVYLEPKDISEELIMIARAIGERLDDKVSIAVFKDMTIPLSAFCYEDLVFGVTVGINADICNLDDHYETKDLLTHELCHAEQIISGRSIMLDDSVVFEGVEYKQFNVSTNLIKYVSLPYEVEAFKCGALAIGKNPLQYIEEYLTDNNVTITKEVKELYSS